MMSHLFLALFATLLAYTNGQFIQATAFSAAGCAATAATGQTFIFAVGACGSFNGSAPYTRITTQTIRGRTFALTSNFMTATCTGTGILQGNLSVGACNNAGGSFLQVASVTAVTQPAGTQGQLFYTSQTACNTAATTAATGFYAASYVTGPTAAQSCASNSNQNFVCPGAFTSTTGGFMIMNYYAAAGCTGVPVQTQATQLGVCSNNGGTTNSYRIFAVPQPNGQTRFNSTFFSGSATCTTGANVQTATAYTGFNTTTCKRTAGAFSSDRVPTGASFYSLTVGTSVGYTSGTGVIAYTTTAGCAAATLSTVQTIVVQSAASVCTQAARGSIMFSAPVLAACPAASTTPSIIYATTRIAVSSTVTLAMAQTTNGPFQTTFINAVANTLGVANTAVAITAVTSTTRRQLLQTGINIAYSVTTVTTAAATITTLLTSSAPTITSYMASTYPGISVAAPTVSAIAPTMAPVKSAATRVSHVNVFLVVMMGVMTTAFFAM